MNMSTVALLLLAWQLLNINAAPRKNTPKQPDLAQFFSDETNNVIDCVGKLSSEKSSDDDKMGALFQIVSSPAVMNLVGNLFPGDKDKKTPEQNASYAASEELVNEEGYRFRTPSEESREFFRPIDNIADSEVKSKLYSFFDNWYIS